jgi:hypothetical protein
MRDLCAASRCKEQECESEVARSLAPLLLDLPLLFAMLNLFHISASVCQHGRLILPAGFASYYCEDVPV